MEIPSPRRVLILSSPSTSTSLLLQALLPTAPSPTSPSDPPIHRILTPYYTASIPIWTLTIASPSAFRAEWLSLPGAADVVAAIGACIAGFHTPVDKAELTSTLSLLRTISSVLAHHTPPHSDAPALFAVALPRASGACLQLKAEDWEDEVRACGGWEYIDGGEKGVGRNEFGELLGMPRLREALAGVDWEGEGPLDEEQDWDLEPEDEELEGSDTPLDAPEAEMRIPILSAEAPSLPPSSEPAQHTTNRTSREREEEELHDTEGADDEGEADVEALQAMLLQMQAAKDMSADLPAGERRRWAARAVREVMRGV